VEIFSAALLVPLQELALDFPESQKSVREGDPLLSAAAK
jgi:hypothetical protein